MTPSAAELAGALEELGYGERGGGDRRQRRVRRRPSARAHTALAEGDRVEVLAPMQGG